MSETFLFSETTMADMEELRKALINYWHKLFKK